MHHQGDATHAANSYRDEFDHALLITTLFVSDGIPLINAGDEYGHSRQGRDCDLNPGRMKKMVFVGMLWKKVRWGMLCILL